MIRNPTQFAEQVAQVLLDATLDQQANPLADLSLQMSQEEFNIFCKVVTFEFQQKIAKQVAAWQQQVLENRIF